jgi:ribosomal protein S18 acetylase RimI-like enzyme
LFEVLTDAKEERFFLPHPLTSDEAARIAGYQGNDFYAAALHNQKAIAYGMLRGWDAGYAVPSLGISVHPAYRGAGVGLAMMHYLHAVAALRDCPSIRLRVNQENQRAKNMYQRLGYQFDEHHSDYLVGVLQLKTRSSLAA